MQSLLRDWEASRLIGIKIFKIIKHLINEIIHKHIFEIKSRYEHIHDHHNTALKCIFSAAKKIK